MTTYNQLFGKYVQNVSTDPTSTDAEGQIWYNSTSGTFKTALGSYGVWSSGGNMTTARIGGIGVGATQSAALKIGGRTQAAPKVFTNATESYNGSSWTSGGTLNTTRGYSAGCGTATSALIFGGSTPAITTAVESYNGSAWTNGTSMNTARMDLGGSANGTQTAALGFGGYNPALGPTPTGIANTESYNGSAWTTVTALPSARFQVGGVGTQTATLGFGGYNGGTLSSTIIWNGSSWTAGPTMAFGSRTGGWFGSSSNDAVVTNGPTTSSVQTYNGVWASANSLATGRALIYGGAGTGVSGLVSGGTTGSYSTATEAWTRSVSVPVAGSWSSGANLNTARSGALGTGTSATAALKIGGYPRTSPIIANVESWNGSAWTTTPSINTARAYLSGCGTQTANFIFGGGPALTTAVESYNGSAWTNGTSMNTARMDLGGAANGTQTAALGFGGYNPALGPSPTGIANVESWNGSSWTTVTALPAARFGVGGVGTQTAALGFGGYNGGTLNSTIVWNGSSWTAGATMAFGQRGGGSFGANSTDAVYAGGGSATSASQIYNGSSWTTTGSLVTGRSSIYGGSGTGPGTGIIAGGNLGPAVTNATELWTGPSTTLNYKTLTTS